MYISFHPWTGCNFAYACEISLNIKCVYTFAFEQGVVFYAARISVYLHLT